MPISGVFDTAFAYSFATKKQAAVRLPVFLYSRNLFRFFLALGQDLVDNDAQDQSARDSGDSHLADGHGHTADTADEDNGNHEQIRVVLKIDLLDHFKAGHGNETVQRDAHTAHYAAGD